MKKQNPANPKTDQRGSSRFTHDSSASAQRQRLLEAMREAPVDTIQARHELDIMMPAARVHELRHKYGYNIIRSWLTKANPGGGEHRIALYALLPGKWQHG